jgi:hypothetical protein
VVVGKVANSEKLERLRPPGTKSWVFSGSGSKMGQMVRKQELSSSEVHLWNEPLRGLG